MPKVGELVKPVPPDPWICRYCRWELPEGKKHCPNCASNRKERKALNVFLKRAEVAAKRFYALVRKGKV